MYLGYVHNPAAAGGNFYFGGGVGRRLRIPESWDTHHAARLVLSLLSFAPLSWGKKDVSSWTKGSPFFSKRAGYVWEETNILTVYSVGRETGRANQSSRRTAADWVSPSHR